MSVRHTCHCGARFATQEAYEEHGRSHANALDHLRAAAVHLDAAWETLTELEKFNTGWRVSTSQEAVGVAIWTLSKPERLMPMEAPK